jgi:hypothetical protein
MSSVSVSPVCLPRNFLGFPYGRGSDEVRRVPQGHQALLSASLLIKTKDLFIFTDDIFALKRISGDVPYPPNGDISSQLEVLVLRETLVDHCAGLVDILDGQF